MTMNISEISNFNDTIADLSRLRTTLKECVIALDDIVASVALGSLSNNDAKHAIYYLSHEKYVLEGRIQQIKKG